MSEDVQSRVLVLWDSLCREVSDLEKDMNKNAVKHNVSAGVRVRKGLREIRKQAALILKESLDADKGVVEERKAKKASKPKE
jgi:hypothetical protein